MPHETARRRNRRAAAFQLQQGAIEKEAITPRQWQSFLSDVDSNRTGSFGLVKLGRLELNSLHPSPEKLTWVKRTTLLEYAAWRASKEPNPTSVVRLLPIVERERTTKRWSVSFVQCLVKL